MKNKSLNLKGSNESIWEGLGGQNGRAKCCNNLNNNRMKTTPSLGCKQNCHHLLSSICKIILNLRIQ